jgi:hypothetical protein
MIGKSNVTDSLQGGSPIDTTETASRVSLGSETSGGGIQLQQFILQGEGDRALYY